MSQGPAPSPSSGPLLNAAGIGSISQAATNPLGSSDQVKLSAYWFSLSFQGGALLAVAVPAQLLGLTSDARKISALALLGGFSALVGMVAQPVAGMLSDLSSSRWGRRRPYLVGGAALDVVGLSLMVYAANIGMLFAGLLLSSLGAAISGAAFQAYIPDHVPRSQVGEASGYLGAMQLLGTIGSFAVAGLVVAPRVASPFYVVTIAVVVAGVSLTAFGIPDPPIPRRGPAVSTSWRALWIDPWRHPDFSWVFVTRSMVMLALYTLFTFVAYFVTDVLHAQLVQGTVAVAGIALVAAVGGGLLTGWLSDRIGRKPLVCAAGELMAVSLLLLAFVHQIGVVMVVGILFGLAYGTYAAVDWALGVDVLPEGTFAAKDLGLWGMSINLPQTVAPFVGGAVISAFAPFGTVAGYDALFIGGAACAALSGIFIWQVRSVR